MQEETADKCVAVVINGGKISEQILRDAVMQAMQTMETNRTGDGKEATYRGKVRIVDLAPEGGELASIEITDRNIRSFERYARKYGVAYALKKDRSRKPPRYIVFFRTKQASQMEEAFREYTARALDRGEKPSIMEAVRRAARQQTKHRERERTKQKSRSEAR
ncbi:MAG: PcfB family protein [Lachnospiraceae bacterium]|nr:PcfB family protein [Lachnospiraceae bacterium]